MGIDGIDRTADQGEGNYTVPTDHALVIEPGGEDDLLAYAMYALTDLDTERPAEAGFSVTAAPIQPGGEEDLPLCFWVGISDYTNYSWEWHGPYTSPDDVVNLDLNELVGGQDIRDRYISAANVLYMVVLTEAGAEFVGPGNPLGLTAARIDLLTIDKLTVGELGYRSTRPHFPLIESIGVGSAAAAGKQAAALDPSQYVTLTWTHVFDLTDPDAEALQYKVYRKGPDDESMIPIGSVNSPEQQYIDPTDNASWVPEVVPGTTYVYYLRAYNNAGFTPFSSAEYVIPLLGPTDLQATDGAFMDKIVLTWTKAEGATGYKIYRDGQAETDVIATLGDVATYDDSGVTDFDPHTYWVRGTTTDLPDGGLFSLPDDGHRSSGAPYADLNANPLSGAAPLTVDFDASASHDPDDGVDPGQGIVKYEWDWEGDGTYDSDSGADPTVSHQYDAAGTYSATVRVTDNDAETATDSVEIQVDWPHTILSLTNPPASGSGTPADPYHVDVATDYVFSVINDIDGDVSFNADTIYTVEPPAAGNISNSDATLNVDDAFIGSFNVSATYLGNLAAPVIYFTVQVPAGLFIMPDPADTDWSTVTGSGTEADPYVLDGSDFTKVYSLIANDQPDGSGNMIDVNTLTWSAMPPFIVVWDSPGSFQASQFTSGYLYAENPSTLETSNYVYVYIDVLP